MSGGVSVPEAVFFAFDEFAEKITFGGWSAGHDRCKRHLRASVR